MSEKLVIGVDFGTDSVRAVVYDTSDGAMLSVGVAAYKRWKQGKYQHPAKSIFRQHPLDYLEALEESIGKALQKITEVQRGQIAAIGVDTTGSTVAPVDEKGVPLSLKEEFAECEDAMFFLWKDHSAYREADAVNAAFGDNPNYLKYQGKYSSEWYWAKIMYAVNHDRRIREQAYTFLEHCDWMVGILCGNTAPLEMYHDACAAGHKALWHSSWNGLPDDKVLASLDSYLPLVKERFGRAPEPSTVVAGHLCNEWAEKLGLDTSVIISGCSFDAHAGAVGAGIRPGTMICTLGTSAVDMIVLDQKKKLDDDITRFCGQAENSIYPGYIGVETGQAAFGDILAWYKKLLLWPVRSLKGMADVVDDASYEKMEKYLDANLLNLLAEKAASAGTTAPALEGAGAAAESTAAGASAEVESTAAGAGAETVGQPDLFAELPVALDWFNGRRYPDTDDDARSTITNLSLGSSAVDLYRALVFGAVSGLKTILDGFERNGAVIDNIIAIGGIAGKSPYLMQMLADLLGKRIEVAQNDQACALGAAMYAAVAAGCYENLEKASLRMASKIARVYEVDKARHAAYEVQFKKYAQLAEKMK